MNTAAETLSAVGLAGALAWLVLLVLQLSDLAASLLDVRGAHENGKPGRPARRRYSEYVWTIPLVLLTVILLVMGIFIATFSVGYQPAYAVPIIIGCVALAILVGIAVVVAMTRGEQYSYGQLLANLTGDSGQRLTAAQVSLFRSQLEEIDGRRRRIHLGFRDRADVAWLRAELDDLAAAFRVVPPTGLGAVSAVRLQTAHTYLWRGNVIRLVPAFLALLVFGCMVSSVVVSGDAAALPVAMFTIVPVIVSYLVALPSARFALAAKVVWHAVNQKQRADAVDRIEEFERSSRKGVTGLGDRVARALQILRDQQETPPAR